MWFIGVEVEQETSVPPPKKNPGSAPADIWIRVKGALNKRREHFKRDCGFGERIHFTGFVWTSADFFF